MKKKNTCEIITKKEFIRKMSSLTGFTQENCTTAYDAIVQIITETILGGRGIYLFKLGWIEPIKRAAKRTYGFKDADSAERVAYDIPETNAIRFRMSEGFKFAFNPGVYKDWRAKK